MLTQTDDEKSLSKLELLIQAPKVARTAFMQNKRRERLENDVWVVQTNRKTERKLYSRKCRNGAYRLIGEHADLFDVIKNCECDSVYVGARHTSWGDTRKLTSKTDKTAKKDAWYLNADAPDLTRRQFIKNLQARPITFELLPVAGHFFWQRQLWFLVNNPNFDKLFSQLSTADNSPHELRSSYLAINADNMELRRFSAKLLPIAKTINAMADHGLAYQPPDTDVAVAYLGRGAYYRPAKLALYTKEYRTTRGLVPGEDAAVWPMWYARTALLKNPEKVHELG